MKKHCRSCTVAEKQTKVGQLNHLATVAILSQSFDKESCVDRDHSNTDKFCILPCRSLNRQELARKGGVDTPGTPNSSATATDPAPGVEVDLLGTKARGPLGVHWGSTGGPLGVHFIKPTKLRSVLLFQVPSC